MKATFVEDPAGWEAFYLDGKLIDQGHSVPNWVIVQALGAKYEYREIETGESGRFPLLLDLVE